MALLKFDYFMKHNVKYDNWSVMRHNNRTGRNTTMFSQLTEDEAFGFLHLIRLGFMTFPSPEQKSKRASAASSPPKAQISTSPAIKKTASKAKSQERPKRKKNVRKTNQKD